MLIRVYLLQFNLTYIYGHPKEKPNTTDYKDQNQFQKIHDESVYKSIVTPESKPNHLGTGSEIFFPNKYNLGVYSESVGFLQT